MRKTHTRVVLDIFTVSDEGASVPSAISNALEGLDYTGSCGVDGYVEIQDVTVETIEVTDSR